MINYSTLEQQMLKVLLRCMQETSLQSSLQSCLLLKKTKKLKDSNPQSLLPHCVVHSNIPRKFLHIISLQGDCKTRSSLCKDCSFMMQVKQPGPNKINAQQVVSSLCCSTDPPYICGKRASDKRLFFFF